MSRPVQIEARAATVRVGPARILDAVDLAIEPGEVVGIVGPNGAGKSTLVAAIAGDRRLAEGSVRLGGRDVTGARPPELARLRAVLPQRSELTLAFTALEVVQLAAPVVATDQARRCLADVELEAFAERSYTSLSGGERQRVQLARVLSQLERSPGAALLLDEPTSALDPKHQRVVLALARRAAGEGRAVVVVLHDLTLAARACDRVALLTAGKLVAVGAPAHVLTPARLADSYAVPFDVVETTAGLVIAAS